jgi:hypothetical protein
VPGRARSHAAFRREEALYVLITDAASLSRPAFSRCRRLGKSCRRTPSAASVQLIDAGYAPVLALGNGRAGTPR